MVTDADNHIELVNPAFCNITGYTLEEVKGRSPSILSSSRHSQHFYTTMWSRCKQKENGRARFGISAKWPSVSRVSSHYCGANEQGQIINTLVYLWISVNVNNMSKIFGIANFDALTGLPNRKLFNERLQHEIHVAQHDSRKLAILLIDLDQFKYINDVQGHATGDYYLKMWPNA